VGSRAAARKAGKHGDLERLPPSFLSSPAVTCNKPKERTRQLILLCFLFFLDLHFSLLLLRICFTTGQFVMGFIFFSSASGGRSGDAAVADVVDGADGSVGAADLAVCC
jgi:hypothetical protein